MLAESCFLGNKTDYFLQKHDSGTKLKLARLSIGAECPLYLCIVLLDSTEFYCGTDTFQLKVDSRYILPLCEEN